MSSPPKGIECETVSVHVPCVILHQIAIAAAIAGHFGGRGGIINWALKQYASTLPPVEQAATAGKDGGA